MQNRLADPQRFRIALAVSLTLHAALLGWQGGGFFRPDALPSQSQLSSSSHLAVKLVTIPDPPPFPAEEEIRPTAVIDSVIDIETSNVDSITSKSGAMVAAGTLGDSLLPRVIDTEPRSIRPGFPDVHYFEKSELTREPRLATEVDLSLDSRGGAQLIKGGKVALQLWLNEEGTVDRVVIVRSDVPYAVTNFIVTAFKAAQFQPGEIDGTAVRSTWATEVSFDSLRR